MEIKLIDEWSDYAIKKNNNRIKEQNTDQTFLEDTYNIPIVEDRRYLIRTGYIAGLVNGVTQQAIAYEPKVYTLPIKDTAIAQTGADKISSQGNKWIKSLSKQGVHPFRQTFKWLIGTRGESWVHIPHNEELAMYEGDWRTSFPNALPVHFILPDPTIVFHDPSEEINGRPQRVLIKCKKSVGEIRATYPHWIGNGDYKDGDMVDYRYFIDNNTRYATADSEPLFRDTKGKLANGDGRLKNIYGFVNMVHKYSGYGIDTDNHDPALLAFTRTRMLREKVIEDSSMATDFRYNMHELAWKIKTIFIPIDANIPDDILKDYRRSPGTINIVRLPAGSEMKVEETQAFDAPAYAYRDRVRADLNAEYPLPLKGQASGTSGRQEDILSTAGMSMYDSPLEANALLWAEALDMGFKVCANKTLGLLPAGISEEDCNSYSELKVDIKKQDPQDMSRRQAEGDRRFEMGIIDMQELYVNYMGKTKEESDKLKARVWIEQAMRTDPAFQQLIIQTAVEEMGQEERLAQIKQMIQGSAKSMNPIPKTGQRGGERRVGNIQTPTGIEQSDLATRHEGRMPPRG